MIKRYLILVFCFYSMSVIMSCDDDNHCEVFNTIEHLTGDCEDFTDAGEYAGDQFIYTVNLKSEFNRELTQSTKYSLTMFAFACPPSFSTLEETIDSLIIRATPNLEILWRDPVDPIWNTWHNLDSLNRSGGIFLGANAKDLAFMEFKLANVLTDTVITSFNIKGYVSGGTIDSFEHTSAVYTLIP